MTGSAETISLKRTVCFELREGEHTLIRSIRYVGGVRWGEGLRGRRLIGGSVLGWIGARRISPGGHFDCKNTGFLDQNLENIIRGL